MIDIISLICYAACVVVIMLLLFGLVRLLFKNRKLFKECLKLRLDVLALSTKISELSQAEQDQRVEKTEGFLRFVSESRDWAFTYIEDVQAAIEQLRIAIDSDDTEVDIETAYEKVISFLPDKLEG